MSNPLLATRTSRHDLTADLPPLVPLAAAADFLHVSTRTLRRWIAGGRLQALRTSPGGSGRLLIARDELARELERMREPRYGAEPGSE